MTRFRLAVVVLLGLLGLVLVLLVARLGERPLPGPPAPVAALPADVPTADVPTADVPTADLPAADVLRAWDEQRAAAYADGSLRQLRRLYVAGSAAGCSDARVLRGYRSRGLVVEGMRTQVLALRVVEQRPDRLRMQVTDRLVGAVAVGPGVRVSLPRDRPDVRTVTLRRGPDRAWRVATVLPVR